MANAQKNKKALFEKDKMVKKATKLSEVGDPHWINFVNRLHKYTPWK